MELLLVTGLRGTLLFGWYTSPRASCAIMSNIDGAVEVVAAGLPQGLPPGLGFRAAPLGRAGPRRAALAPAAAAGTTPARGL